MPATSYCGTSDLNRLLESFVTEFYGTNGYGDSGTVYDDMQTTFKQLNEDLDSIGRFRTIPLGTQSDGLYPRWVIECQSNLIIYQKLRSRFLPEFQGVPDWIKEFKESAKEIIQDVEDGSIVGLDETSLGEQGISAPTSTQTGVATFYNNFDDPSSPYTGEGVQRTYKIQIDSVSSGSSIGLATYKWSKDGGVSWEESSQSTGTSWDSLENNIRICWQPYTSLAGTQVQLALNDYWTFVCTPTNKVAYGNKKYAKQRFFSRG